jgi:hypothetical protein
MNGGGDDPPLVPDMRPRARIAVELRARIIHGIIAPGTRLDPAEIAGIAGRWLPTKAALQALSDLKTESLVTWERYRWYAMPAGPHDPAVGVRLGTTLAALRRAAGRTRDDLAGGRYWADDEIREAEENGAWQPRDFWAQMDDRVGADGTLIKLHDSAYVGPGPRPGDPEPVQGPQERPDSRPRTRGMDQAIARAAAEIAARVKIGEWPPGSRLPSQAVLSEDHATNSGVIGPALRELAGQCVVIRTDYGYFTPGPLAHETAAPAVRTLTAVILVWDDGTQTRNACVKERA